MPDECPSLPDFPVLRDIGTSLWGSLRIARVARLRADTFDAGAILLMLANTMIPQACEQDSKLAGVLTVLGFAAAVLVAVLERAGVAQATRGFCRDKPLLIGGAGATLLPAISGEGKQCQN
jgi:hypothetical protein